MDIMKDTMHLIGNRQLAAASNEHALLGVVVAWTCEGMFVHHLLLITGNEMNASVRLFHTGTFETSLYKHFENKN